MNVSLAGPHKFYAAPALGVIVITDAAPMPDPILKG
jgi:hypothetical protein